MNSNSVNFEQILNREQRAWNVGALRFAVILAVIVFCAHYVGLFDGKRLADGVPSLFSLVGEMMPPNFSDARNWVKPVLDTLAMSIAGTALAICLSLPLAFLAARNTTPHPLVYQFARSLLNAVGFGALPGVLALGLHSIGMVGKFFAEAIEHADQAPIEAARAAGATPLQVLLHGVLPQVLPQLADTSIYRWEYNFRASTVMGMVGAGGIGFELMGSLRIMQYQDVSAILLVILLMVTLVDAFSGYLRKRFK